MLLTTPAPFVASVRVVQRRTDALQSRARPKGNVERTESFVNRHHSGLVRDVPSKERRRLVRLAHRLEVRLCTRGAARRSRLDGSERGDHA